MKRFAQFELKELIDQGGNAAVYRAQNIKYPIPIAIKIIHPHLITKDLPNEPSITHHLQHPHIVPILEHGLFEGRPYTVMPFLSGGSLDKQLQGNPLPLDKTMTILRPIAQALDYAHGQGVIHRDVKPANILFDGANEVYLTDFGIAQLMEATTAGGNNSGIFGTAHYLSPEQAQDRPLNGRSDQYGLAVMAYEMLSGKRPFTATTPVNLALQHINAPIPDINQQNPSLPAYINPVLQKGMAKEPQARYDTCSAFVQALQTPIATTPQTKIQTNARVVLTFLQERLTADEFVEFCFIEYPTVHNGFTIGMTRKQQIQGLLAHVRVEQTLAELVAKLKEYYPQRAINL